MKSFSLSELNRHPGEIVDAALFAPVSLTKHGKRKLVMMDAATYERLAVTRAFMIKDAPEDVHRELMEGLNDILSTP
jgi:prevent-host-death family protein